MARFRNIVLIPLLWGWLIPGPGYGQVTLFPEIDKSDVSHPVQIIRVEVTTQYTIIDFYFTPRREGTWICLDKNFYITPANFDDRRYMIMAKDIDICPKMTKVASAENDLEFSVYFPPVEKGIFKIDVLEPKTGFKFYGVHINNNGGMTSSEVSDTIQVIQILKKMIDKPADDSLSGVWERNIKRRHFTGQDVIIGEYTEIPDTVILIRKGKNYNFYNLKGKALDESIVRLTGALGYFYQKQLNEVNSAGSGYLEWQDSDNFVIRYGLPLRLAKYIVLGEFLDSDHMTEQQEYRKLNVEEIKQLIQSLTDTGQQANVPEASDNHDKD